MGGASIGILPMSTLLLAGRLEMFHASRPRTPESVGRRRAAFSVVAALCSIVAMFAVAAGPAHASYASSHPSAPPPLRVPAPTTNTSVLDLGMTLFATLNASNVTGGSGNPANYQYQWFGLPPSCTTANVSNFSCAPTNTGTFTITVTVNDTSTHRTGTSAAVSITVNTDPTISSFTVSATSVAVNGSITFTATASGGSLPYAMFVYKGLPSGCTGNTSTLTCSPGVAQNYNVSVVVIDAVGMPSNQRNLTVTVTAGASPSSTKGPTVAEWGIIAAILIIGFALAALLWMRARKEERASYAATPSPPPPGAPPPPSSPPSAPPAG